MTPLASLPVQSPPGAEGIVGGATTLVLFALYLAAMVGIGLWAARRSGGTQEGFFLGGRKLSSFVVALSAVSSGRSAWLVLGASAVAWDRGLSALWLFPGYVTAEFLLLFSLGRRLRVRSANIGAITIPEVLSGLSRGEDGRLGSSRLPIKPVAGAIVVLFLTSYVSAQLVAGGKALEAIFHIDGATWGLCLTAGIVLAYTFLGGYRAVAITDVVQAVFMIVGLVVLPLAGLAHVGGFSGLREALLAIDPELLAWSRGWKTALAGLAIGLGSFGSPPILTRAMSIRDPRQLVRASIIGTSWNVVMASGALLIGLVGRAIHASATDFPGADPEHLYAMLGAEMSRELLFGGFVGVLLAALFAAIMSTCDSQLLVVASSFVRDFRGKSLDGRGHGGVATSRLAVFVAIFVAVSISFGAEKSVQTFVLFSWDALGSAFGPALLALLFWKRTTALGVFASMIAGVAVVMLWGQVPELAGIIHQRIVGFAAASFVIVLTAKR